MTADALEAIKGRLARFDAEQAAYAAYEKQWADWHVVNEFMTHAPNDVRALLAAIETLQREKRWREADEDRRMALDALKAQRAITDEAIGILRTFRDRLDVHARV